jgi:hypothetical protein
MSAFSYFIGTTQSKYASVAMILAVLMICFAIIFTNTDVPIGNRIAVAFFVLLMSIFPIAISLFELTCIVTGGKNTKYNLCGVFAWFVTILIVIYCFLLILVTLTSMFTYKKAYEKLEVSEKFTSLTKDAANKIAKNLMVEEQFADVPAQIKPSELEFVPVIRKNKLESIGNRNILEPAVLPSKPEPVVDPNRPEPISYYKPPERKKQIPKKSWFGYEKIGFMPLK